ncbi:MAG: hypothetical protein KBC12_01735 [Candidatus Pacebacteria bacterium]|nr:hypothetical protein [Candidatus Paceibacterota bacterium]MBP9851407.1 hypothetical protein [Candidatus Paceibacterota bacterium]
MKNVYKKIILSVVVLCFAFAGIKADAQSVTSAVLNASVNPGGTRTTAWFEYGTNSSLNTWTETQHELIGTFNYAKAFSQTVYNLQPNTLYYFRVVTNNGYDTYRAGILSFTTGSNNTSYNTNQTSYNYNDGYNYTDQNTVNVTRYVVNETKYIDRVVQPQTVYTQPQTVSYQPVSYQYQPVAYQPVSYQTVAYQPMTSNVVYQPAAGQVAYQPMTNTGYVPATTYTNNSYTAPIATTNTTLAAAPIFGANFLPTNLFGWLILLALILAVVFVVRRLARV